MTYYVKSPRESSDWLRMEGLRLKILNMKKRNSEEEAIITSEIMHLRTLKTSPKLDWPWRTNCAPTQKQRPYVRYSIKNEKPNPMPPTIPVLTP